MKTFFLIIKQQKLFLVVLSSFVLAPYLLLCVIGPDIPYVPYFFLFILFFLKIAIFDENTLEKKLTPAVRKELQKEKKQPPSKQEVFNRVKSHIRHRDFTLLFTILIVVMGGIIFEKF